MERTRRKSAAYYRKQRQSRLSIFMVFFVMLIILVVVSVHSRQLRQKLDAYELTSQVLQEQIDLEEKRAVELEEYRKYTQTLGYVEEIAKEKLGLVYEGEIIFKETK